MTVESDAADSDLDSSIISVTLMEPDFKKEIFVGLQLNHMIILSWFHNHKSFFAIHYSKSVQLSLCICAPLVLETKCM